MQLCRFSEGCVLHCTQGEESMESMALHSIRIIFGLLQALSDELPFAMLGAAS